MSVGNAELWAQQPQRLVLLGVFDANDQIAILGCLPCLRQISIHRACILVGYWVSTVTLSALLAGEPDVPATFGIIKVKLIQRFL